MVMIEGGMSSAEPQRPKSVRERWPNPSSSNGLLARLQPRDGSMSGLVAYIWTSARKRL